MQRARAALAKARSLPFVQVSAAEMSHEAPLGKGGFGEVTSVLCREIVMARKRLSASSRADEEQVLKYLLKEVRAMAAVDHPNTIKLYGVCLERGHLSILMQYAELGTLRDQLDSDPLMPAWKRFQLQLGITNGVRALHAHTPRPIVHGDLKSLNVLITIDAATGGWTAKISDFGLATGGSGSGLTTTAKSSAHGAGTVSHSPPEVLDDVSPYTTAGDIFSLGVIAWEVATGDIPWEGKQAGTVMRQVVDKQRRLPVPAAPADGSVFDAAQWALFAEQLLPGGQASDGRGTSPPGGCWAHEPADRPDAAAVFRLFRGAAVHFAAPPGAARDLQLEHLNHKMDAMLSQQEAMHRDVREIKQHTTRMNGALNALVAGEGVECFRLFWIVPAPPSGDGKLLSRIKDRAAALNPASWLAKDVLLVPLDELDLQPIPCGPDGAGFPLTLPKKFYKDHAAAIKLSYKLLQYALKSGKLVGLPLPQVRHAPCYLLAQLVASPHSPACFFPFCAAARWPRRHNGRTAGQRLRHRCQAAARCSQRRAGRRRRRAGHVQGDGGSRRRQRGQGKDYEGGGRSVPQAQGAHGREARGLAREHGRRPAHQRRRPHRLGARGER